jgi:hypothetical protein
MRKEWKNQQYQLVLDKWEEDYIIKLYTEDNLSPYTISDKLKSEKTFGENPPGKSWITNFLTRKMVWTGSKSGRPKSKSHRESISIATIQRYSDPEQRKVTSEAKIEFYSSPENRKLQSDRMRKSIENGFTPYLSKGEFLVKEFLMEKGFRHQYTFITSRSEEGFQKSNFRLDFYHPELRINIEIDGVSHEWNNVIEKDLEKDLILRSLGVRVFRVKEDSNLRSNIERLINQELGD